MRALPEAVLENKSYESARRKKTNGRRRYLGLLDGRGVAVAHGADVKPSLPLQVALDEELLHHSVRPLLVYLKWFGWVA